MALSIALDLCKDDALELGNLRLDCNLFPCYSEHSFSGLSEETLSSCT